MANVMDERYEILMKMMNTVKEMQQILNDFRNQTRQPSERPAPVSSTQHSIEDESIVSSEKPLRTKEDEQIEDTVPVDSQITLDDISEVSDINVEKETIHSDASRDCVSTTKLLVKPKSVSPALHGTIDLQWQVQLSYLEPSLSLEYIPMVAGEVYGYGFAKIRKNICAAKVFDRSSLHSHTTQPLFKSQKSAKSWRFKFKHKHIPKFVREQCVVIRSEKTVLVEVCESEGVVVGMKAVITKKDAIITAYCGQCIFLDCGGLPHEIFSELMGRQAGCSKDKGGSVQSYKKETTCYGCHGIVGALFPLGMCGDVLHYGHDVALNDRTSDMENLALSDICVCFEEVSDMEINKLEEKRKKEDWIDKFQNRFILVNLEVKVFLRKGGVIWEIKDVYEKSMKQHHKKKKKNWHFKFKDGALEEMELYLEQEYIEVKSETEVGVMGLKQKNFDTIKAKIDIKDKELHEFERKLMVRNQMVNNRHFDGQEAVLDFRRPECEMVFRKGDSIAKETTNGAEIHDGNVHLDGELGEDGEFFDQMVALEHYTKRGVAAVARMIVEVMMKCHSNKVMHRGLRSDNSGFVDTLEKLMQLSSGVEVLIDELGKYNHPTKEMSLFLPKSWKFKFKNGISKEELHQLEYLFLVTGQEVHEAMFYKRREEFINVTLNKNSRKEKAFKAMKLDKFDEKHRLYEFLSYSSMKDFSGIYVCFCPSLLDGTEEEPIGFLKDGDEVKQFSVLSGAIYYLQQAILVERLLQFAKFESLSYCDLSNINEKQHMVINAASMVLKGVIHRWRKSMNDTCVLLFKLALLFYFGSLLRPPEIKRSWPVNKFDMNLEDKVLLKEGDLMQIIQKRYESTAWIRRARK